MFTLYTRANLFTRVYLNLSMFTRACLGMYIPVY